jgi:hypothetical protein
LLKGRDRLFSRHGRKVFEELAKRIPSFEVIEQGLKRHPSPAKTGVPPMISGSLCTTGVSLFTRLLRI